MLTNKEEDDEEEETNWGGKGKIKNYLRNASFNCFLKYTKIKNKNINASLFLYES